jgi:hypothetical protein
MHFAAKSSQSPLMKDLTPGHDAWAGEEEGEGLPAERDKCDARGDDRNDEGGHKPGFLWPQRLSRPTDTPEPDTRGAEAIYEYHCASLNRPK